MATVLSDYDSRQGRGLTWIVFLVFSMGLLMASSVIPLPSQEAAEQALEILMLETMVFQEENIADVEDEIEDVQEEVEELMAQPVENQEGRGETPDLAALMAAFEGPAEAPIGAVSAELSSRTGAPTNLVDGELDISSTDAFGAFGGDIDLTAGLVTRDNAQGSSRTLAPGLIARGQDTGARIGLDGLGSTGLGIGDGVIGTGRSIGGTDLVGSDRGVPVLKPREVKMEVPVPEVVDWLRLRQSTIDRGIQALFRYTGEEMTAKERIVVGGQPYGLQLMYTPSSRSLHVSLLIDNVIYYFVDPGSQGRANYFQKGFVRRDEGGFVVLVESEDFSPRGAEAMTFFQVFRSWWDSEDSSQP